MPLRVALAWDGLMRCKKCEKLIQRMLDGDLAQEEREDVMSHIESCPGCASYYEDMRAMRGMLREPDREPPEGFRAGWKVALANAAAGEAKPARRRSRLAAVIPAVAAGAVAVVVLSVSMFGGSSKVPALTLTSGRNTTAQVSAQVTSEPAGSADDGAILFQGVTEPEQAVSTTQPAPEYSVTTTATHEDPGVVSTGSIEVKPEASAPEWHFGDGPADLAPASPYEVPVADQTVADQIRALAAEQGVTVRDDEDVPGQFVMVGTPEVVQEILETQGYSIPAGTSTVAVIWETGPAE